MKAILSLVVFAALVFPLTEHTALAQAPTGPQPGAQPQQNPPPVKTPDASQKPPDAGVAIAVDVPIVTLDVVATTQHGDIIPGLKKENFRILDDGAPQTITNFGATDAPITMVLLLEFSSRGYGGFFAYVGKYWSTALFPALLQKDWVALETFDMKTRVEVDFTQNKDEVMQGLYRLYFPGFSESNVFDAILETVDRLKDVQGKKSIVVLASGVDTFSKHTLDQTMKQLRQSDVTIFCIGLGRAFQNYADMNGGMGGKSAQNICTGNRRLLLVPPIRRRDAGCVPQRCRLPSPSIQHLLLAVSRREGRKISQSQSGIGRARRRPAQHRRSKGQEAEIPGLRPRRLSVPQERRRRLMQTQNPKFENRKIKIR
jgi:hypothetical protein